MVAVLLPIKPIFVKDILSGAKKYEFRKNIFKDDSVDTILIYSSYPVKKVVAEIKIKTIIHDTIQNLYELRKKCTNPDFLSFNEYFKNQKKGYAIEFLSIDVFKEPKDLLDFNIKYAPQSFCYIR